MKYTIKTSPLLNRRILQEVDHERLDGVLETIIRQVYDTREVQFVKALIKLGWTPPKDKNG